MKIRTERKFDSPITVVPGDSIELSHKTDYVMDGEIMKTKTTKVLESKIKTEMIFTKGVIFDVEESDGMGGVGIGGAFIQEEDVQKIRLNVSE